MHSRLEQYVEQVETRLTQLPPAQRESETEELRQHIASMVEARMASGLCEEKAITDTLEQFGRAQTVSRALTRVHQRQPRFLPDNLLTALLCCVLCTYGGVIALFMSLFVVQRNGLHLRFVDGFAQPVQLTYAAVVMLTGCLVVGGITGSLFPRRAVWGTLLAYLVWSAMAASNVAFQRRMFLWDYLFICAFWVVTAAFTMGGAKMGAAWRKRRLHRKRLVV